MAAKRQAEGSNLRHKAFDVAATSRAPKRCPRARRKRIHPLDAEVKL
jgi:hypothetical protein